MCRSGGRICIRRWVTVVVGVGLLEAGGMAMVFLAGLEIRRW